MAAILDEGGGFLLDEGGGIIYDEAGAYFSPLAAVTQVTYNSGGMPSGTVQLA